MAEICVLYSFARSGGTLLNRLLGVHPDCWVLSEVNPAGAVMSAAQQGHEWLGAITKDEYRSFSDLPYGRQIERLAAIATEREKRLIVRDWVTVNFLSGVGGPWQFPSETLEQAVYLDAMELDVTAIVLTRRAGDVYGSIRRAFSQLTQLDEDTFAAAYLKYATAVASLPRVSLESLQQAPQENLCAVMRILGISEEYVEQQIVNFSDFVECTGDVGVADSRTAALTRIEPQTKRSTSDQPLYSHPDMIAADQLLGYAI